MKMKEKIIIILSTHSSYLDICEIFLNLLEINWKDCPFDIVISITGENIMLDGYHCIYNGQNATLPDCLRSACEQAFASHYICVLGDAFIMKKIQTKEIVVILKELINREVEYCNLLPNKVQRKNCKGNNIREIYEKDIYSHSFVSFFASREFIFKQFTLGSTDLDFEEQYLKIAAEASNNHKFDKHYIFVRNVFHIMPGISKGLWDWKVYRYLKRNYPDINVECRKKLGIKETIRGKIISLIQPRINPKLRFKIKTFLREYLNMNFTAKY